MAHAAVATPCRRPQTLRQCGLSKCCGGKKRAGDGARRALCARREASACGGRCAAPPQAPFSRAAIVVEGSFFQPSAFAPGRGGRGRTSPCALALAGEGAASAPSPPAREPPLAAAGVPPPDAATRRAPTARARQMALSHLRPRSPSPEN